MFIYCQSFLTLATTRQWSVSQSARLKLRTSSIHECHLLSINLWWIWLWVFPSGEFKVCLWMSQCRNIVLCRTGFFDVAKFTILTQLSLISWCRLSFQILHLISPSKIRKCLCLWDKPRNKNIKKLPCDLHMYCCFKHQIFNYKFSDFYISQTWAADELLWEFFHFIKDLGIVCERWMPHFSCKFHICTQKTFTIFIRYTKIVPCGTKYAVCLK